MNRNTKKVISLLLCFVLTVAAMPVFFDVQAQAVTQDEINALKAQRDLITAQRKEKQAVVDKLEAEKAGIVAQKKALDERNQYTIEQIKLNNEVIEMYERMIEEKGLDVTAAKALEDEQLERYRTRVRAMEENGSLNYLALVLQANNLGELLTAIDDIGEIMVSDKTIENQYRAARENTEKVKAEYEDYCAEIREKQDALREEQAKLEGEIEEANALIEELVLNIQDRQEEADQIYAAEAEANAKIDEMVAELEAARRKAAGASNAAAATGTASFVFPVASYTYISSRFGLRTHPITGEKKSHTGLDIASNSGTAVYAADGGTVTMASWNGGYGNCIMIDHGNGYVTLYGHLSGYSVSKGDEVYQGQTIGAVGSTGNSTGPHLHFEVLKAGTRVDPEQYFSGLVISKDAGE